MFNAANHAAAMQQVMTKIAATRALLKSKLMKDLRQTLTGMTIDPIMKQSANLAFCNFTKRSDIATGEFDAFIANAVAAMDAGEASLLEMGAKPARRTYKALTAREADDALMPFDGSLRITHEEGKLVSHWVRDMSNIKLAQEALSNILAGYRYVTRDYDASIPHEKAFMDLTRLLIGTVSNYYGDLIHIDRDTIRRSFENPGQTIAIGSKPCGSGTASACFAVEFGEANLYSHEALAKSPVIYLLDRGNWKITSVDALREIGQSYARMARTERRAA